MYLAWTRIRHKSPNRPLLYLALRAAAPISLSIHPNYMVSRGYFNASMHRNSTTRQWSSCCLFDAITTALSMLRAFQWRSAINSSYLNRMTIAVISCLICTLSCTPFVALTTMLQDDMAVKSYGITMSRLIIQSLIVLLAI